jgi:hypothetical protein
MFEKTNNVKQNFFTFKVLNIEKAGFLNGMYINKGKLEPPYSMIVISFTNLLAPAILSTINRQYRISSDILRH